MRLGGLVELYSAISLATALLLPLVDHVFAVLLLLRTHHVIQSLHLCPCNTDSHSSVINLSNRYEIQQDACTIPNFHHRQSAAPRRIATLY
jgi:hypothetical protein